MAKGEGVRHSSEELNTEEGVYMHHSGLSRMG